MYIIGLGAIGLLHSFKSLKPINRISKNLKLDDHKLIDALIVALKGPQIKAIYKLKNRINSDTTIVILSNGCLKIYKDLREKLVIQNPKFVLGTVTHGAYRTLDGQVVHSGKGKTCLGALGGYNQEHVDELMREWKHLNVEWVGNDIRTVLEEKLAINCAINPLTALLDVQNGGLLGSDADRDCTRLVENYLKDQKNLEISHFIKSRKSGIATGLVERIIEEFTTVFPSHNPHDLLLKTVDVLTKTKDNHNSMKVDVEKGQETEIDYLTGYLLEVAKEPLPFNQMVLDMIKQKPIL